MKAFLLWLLLMGFIGGLTLLMDWFIFRRYRKG